MAKCVFLKHAYIKKTMEKQHDGMAVNGSFTLGDSICDQV